MNRIKELRKSRKMLQEDIAIALGVTTTTVIRWENGKVQVRSKNAKKLSDYFNVSEAYLLGYSDNDNPKLDWDSVVEYLSELSDFDYKKMIEVVDEKRLSE